jgi:hypothetical protein
MHLKCRYEDGSAVRVHVYTGFFFIVLDLKLDLRRYWIIVFVVAKAATKEPVAALVCASGSANPVSPGGMYWFSLATCSGKRYNKLCRVLFFLALIRLSLFGQQGDS